ncbi:MAG: hypothetical protein KJ607_05045 [Bacteroidetes bacterium]|nr:hypothetical protein [Bacteroidota bacterium]
MDNYLNQLIAQLHEAAANAPAIKEAGNASDPDDGDDDIDNDIQADFHYIDQVLYGEERPLSEILGIQSEYLPDDSKLTDEQVSLVAKEAEALWKAYHYIPVFPEGLPYRLRYRVMRESWDSPQVFFEYGSLEIEFCDYEQERCPFPGYCDICEELMNDTGNNEESQAANDPVSVIMEGMTARSGRKQKQSQEQEKKPEKKKKRLTREERFRILMRKGPDENDIPGIYNYCDRWCEKCAFTGRCTNYAMSDELFDDEDITDDAESETKEVNLMMHETSQELLQEQKKDIETERKDVEDIISRRDPEELKIKNHPVAKVSYQYGMDVFDWMKAKSAQIDLLLESGIIKGREGLTGAEAIETIRWYSHFIAAKLYRAVSGYTRLDDEFYEIGTYDMNGSAKIALIAIEKSIEAWDKLLKQFPRLEEDISTFISTLVTMGKETEQLFPDARSFIRPGFDE